MENVLSSLPEPKTEADYEAALEVLLGEMRSNEEKMSRDRAEIERLKEETRMIATRTDFVLANVQRQLDQLQKVG